MTRARPWMAASRLAEFVTTNPKDSDHFLRQNVPTRQDSFESFLQLSLRLSISLCDCSLFFSPSRMEVRSGTCMTCRFWFGKARIGKVLIVVNACLKRRLGELAAQFGVRAWSAATLRPGHGSRQVVQCSTLISSSGLPAMTSMPQVPAMPVLPAGRVKEPGCVCAARLRGSRTSSCGARKAGSGIA